MIGGAARALAFALLVLVPAAPAAATFPGANGPIVIALPGEGQCRELGGHLASTPWDRVALTPITPACQLGEEEHEQRRTFAPDFAPAGNRLLAQQSDAEPEGIVTLGADGSGPAGVPVSGAAPSFAPDGERFAYESGSAVWIARLDGTGARRVVGSARCGSACVRALAPRWSPDGRHLAVHVQGPGIKPGIWLVRPGNGDLVRRVAGAGAAEADWSPDSRWLVYRSRYQQREIEGGASGGNLYVVRRDGARRRRIVHRSGTAETTPRWSPDGRWIAWISLDFTPGDVSFEVRPTLYRIRVSGGRERGSAKRMGRLPRPYQEEGFWSPPTMTWGALAE